MIKREENISQKLKLHKFFYEVFHDTKSKEFKIILFNENVKLFIFNF